VLIEPLTVVAQVVNFLVLVVVLKYVLYDRIVAAMDQREHHIAERIAAAERAEREAQAEAASFRHERHTLGEARERLLDQARDAAEQRREELTRDARADVDELRRRWTGTLQREHQRLLRELQERAGQQLVTIGRRVLRDLADAALEDQAIEVAVRELEAEGAIRQLAERAAGTGSALEVHTAFPLSDDRRHELEARLSRCCGDGIPLLFEVDPALVCGLEVRAAGEAAGWSVAGYLDDLAVEVDRALPVEEPS
jgi:F-type H+-transporting ATPase subunit b